MSDVIIKMDGYDRFAKAIADMSAPVRKAFRQIAAIYRGAMQERFVSFSRGAGGWPDLKDSTKRRRRGPREGFKGNRSFSLLRDTNTLFHALDATLNAGGVQADLPNGIKTGFGGPARHPKGKATIADIARFHHEGLGHLPKRTLLAQPTPASLERMRGVLQGGVDQAAADTGGK